MLFSRITIEQAEKYIPFVEDFKNKTPRYFTISPSTDPNYPASKGWDEVTYYSGRDVDKYSNLEGEGDSWVYIMSNPSFKPNQYKIGYTDNTPDVRAKQLSRGTGVPQPFVVEFGFYCFNAKSAEGEIHRALRDCRINDDREFFLINLQDAKDIVENICSRYK